jgi:amino acid permease
MSSGHFSRDEVLGGLPERRAHTLLFLIESQTAREVLADHQRMDPLLSPAAAEVNELAILDAFRLSRTPPVPVTVQNLEHFAPRWAELVPANPQVRAATAHALGTKYLLPASRVPGIRAALGLDDPAVAGAYERHYGAPLQGLYHEQLPLRERVRWAWAALGQRLGQLPPSWMVFALIFTETVGAGILALPIAMAGVGPIPGVVVLLAVGVLNILTVGFMAEAVSRNGLIRGGSGFIGRLVEDYLGRLGALILSAGVAAICGLALVAYYVGLATLLRQATGIRAEMWVALIAGMGIFFVTRRNLHTTMTAALVVGGINIVLILVLSAMALQHADPSNWTYVNPSIFQPGTFDPAALQLVFGVALVAFFGHLSISNSAQAILQQDPGGRSLILGAMSAQLLIIFVYCLWVLAVSGAVPPAELAAARGTSLDPLADAIGPFVYVVGGLFAALGMGMASIHYSLALANMVRERLPRPNRAPATVRVSLDPAEAVANDEAEAASAAPWRGAVERWHNVLIVAPILTVFLVTEWQFLTGTDSFTETLNVIGIIVISLLGVLFPALLLVASRRKGDEVPALVVAFFGRPALIFAVIALSVATLILHGTVIWQDPLQRVFALSTSGLVIFAMLRMWRQGIFRPRIVVELRGEPAAGRLAFAVSAGGQPMATELRFTTADGVEQLLAARGAGPSPESVAAVEVALPEGAGNSLKVWSHELDYHGESQPWPAWLSVSGPEGRQSATLTAGRDTVKLPLAAGAHTLAIRWSEAPAASEPPAAFEDLPPATVQ